MCTPRKVKDRICVVCKTTDIKKEWRKIQDLDKGRSEISDLLFKYGGVDIIEGFICRNCVRKLFNINKQCRDFRSVCQNNIELLTVKRCKSDFDESGENEPDRKRGAKNLFTTSTPLKDVSNISFLPPPVTPLAPESKRTTLNISGIIPIDCADVPSRKHCLILPSPVPCRNIASSLVAEENTTPPPQGQDESGYASHATDHTYASINQPSTHQPKKQSRSVQKKPNDQIKPLMDIINRTHVDNLSDGDCSEIVSVLPLRSVNKLLDCVLSNPNVKSAIMSTLMTELSRENKVLKNRKRGKLSVLMKKDYEDLQSFEWTQIIQEMCEEYPLVAQMCTSFMLPEGMDKLKRDEKLETLIPRIGLIYSIMAQGRNKELSRIQRVVDMLLFDNICDQKVFDRLQPLGICLGYNRSLDIIENLADTSKSAVVDAIKLGKRIRLVGDNINWKTGVADERQDNHGHMNHAFGSAVVIQNVNFDHLDNTAPQLHHSQADIDTFLPSAEDWSHISTEYSVIIASAIRRLIPSLGFMSDVMPKKILGPLSEEMSQKNKVVLLPVLHLNEQKYEDVVKIMDFYEDFLDDYYREAGVESKKTHIGGDQLTRERFSGAKRLRAGGTTEKEQLSHLSPVTFELFHLLMNYVKLIFHQLYNESSGTDIGTMKCEQNRILRSNVNVNVNDHYDADKDFITSFVDCHIVEAVLDYFGMEDVNGKPTKHIPPESWQSDDMKKMWVEEMLKNIVEGYIYNTRGRETENVQEDGFTIPIKLADGITKNFFFKKVQSESKVDYIKNYAHLVLELGMLFKALLDLCKFPDRDRGIRLLKVAMIHFKSNNHLSKYAYEILRILVHQHCVLSIKEAHEEFYGLFVNTKGHVDSNIPCDLQMEFLVKEVKKNIKHMFSNQTQQNITKRTSALPAIKDISANFDSVTKVISRAKKHSDTDSFKDESDMIDDLRTLKPFQFKAGRAHAGFQRIPSHINSLLDTFKFHEWILQCNFKYATELGR